MCWCTHHTLALVAKRDDFRQPFHQSKYSKRDPIMCLLICELHFTHTAPIYQMFMWDLISIYGHCSNCECPDRLHNSSAIICMYQKKDGLWSLCVCVKPLRSTHRDLRRNWECLCWSSSSSSSSITQWRQRCSLWMGALGRLSSAPQRLIWTPCAGVSHTRPNRIVIAIQNCRLGWTLRLCSFWGQPFTKRPPWLL